jgi:hypothetical protein
MRPTGSGLECANCGSHMLAVKDSRRSVNSIRRRRKCLGCGRRFTTFEVMSPATDDGTKLVAALLLWDKLRSVPAVHREALMRMINALATREGPVLAPPMIEGPAP